MYTKARREERLTFCDFGTAVRLFDDNVPTLRATRQHTKTRQAQIKSKTFWPKRNTDSVCKYVDAFENARAALIRELNFLVDAASENGASSPGRSTTERARGRRSDVMHGVGMCEFCGKGRREETRRDGMTKR